MAKIAKEAMEDKKGEDLKVLDLNGLSNIAEYFVIGSGSNPNQVRAMADNANEKLFKAGFKLHHSEGYSGGAWVLLDYGNLIIHIFDREQRSFYGIEGIWGDAKEC
ncbi:Ribosomal silencing factor RsfS [bioreactor metagenome]|uniref:Ribosomal silencing factor RsfS n=1 Tax=bioreactor metagenome TaxID=1076179 RepID=A0A644YWG4_9ZZZZ